MELLRLTLCIEEDLRGTTEGCLHFGYKTLPLDGVHKRKHSLTWVTKQNRISP